MIFGVILIITTQMASCYADAALRSACHNRARHRVQRQAAPQTFAKRSAHSTALFYHSVVARMVPAHINVGLRAAPTPHEAPRCQHGTQSQRYRRSCIKRGAAAQRRREAKQTCCARCRRGHAQCAECLQRLAAHAGCPSASFVSGHGRAAGMHSKTLSPQCSIYSTPSGTSSPCAMDAHAASVLPPLYGGGKTCSHAVMPEQPHARGKAQLRPLRAPASSWGRSECAGCNGPASAPCSAVRAAVGRPPAASARRRRGHPATHGRQPPAPSMPTCPVGRLDSEWGLVEGFHSSAGCLL